MPRQGQFRDSAIALLAVLPATLIHSELAAAGLLAGVATVFAAGEIAHILVLAPLVSDMAPPHLLGRYLSLYGLTFSFSVALGPAIGGFLLQTSPDAIWWGGALAAALAGAVLLGLGDRIPDSVGTASRRQLAVRERDRYARLWSLRGRSPDHSRTPQSRTSPEQKHTGGHEEVGVGVQEDTGGTAQAREDS